MAGGERYRKRIAKGLKQAYGDAGSASVEITELRAVAFSDHHRGKGDGADDFRGCEDAYCAALGWYLEQDFGLWLLGDVEELWEARPRQVMAHYDDVLDLEAEFGDRLWRFYGNHDMAWKREKNVKKFLTPHYTGQPVREGLKLTVTDRDVPLGTLFLVHGHQGTIDSGNALVVPISRFAVRTFWGTAQRIFKFASTSPATDTQLRADHDIAMADWADAHPERIVLVAGHTHHPVFPGEPPKHPREEFEELDAAYAAATGADRPQARGERERARVRAMRSASEGAYALPPEPRRPSYFNTGCCSFGDGDVTGIEFAHGNVRLVRWLNNDGRARPQPLTEPRSLREIFESVTGDRPSPAIPAGV